MKRFAIIALAVATLTHAALLISAEPPDLRSSHMPVVGPFAELENLLPKGSPAPEFTLKDPDGKPVALKDFRGKLVVLEFGART